MAQDVARHAGVAIRPRWCDRFVVRRFAAGAVAIADVANAHGAALDRRLASMRPLKAMVILAKAAPTTW